MNISKEENVFSFIASGINITHILSLWLNPIIVTIGLICNLITICVFLRKCLRQMQISIYIISLAISDICVLVYILLNWLDDIILFDSNAWCKFHGYIDLVFCSTSTWNLVALAHQRWLAVASKNQIYTQQKTSTKNYFEVLIIWLFSALANIWYPILIYKNESENSCLVEYKILFKLFGIFSILITYFTPFVFIVTFNSLLIRSLRKRIERRRQMGLALPHGETLISQLRRHLQEQHQNNAMSDKTINKMLITISVSFVIFTFPYQLIWIFKQILSFIQDESYPDVYNLSLVIASDLTLILRNINFTMNFFLYTATSTLFRENFILMFKCK